MRCVWSGGELEKACPNGSAACLSSQRYMDDVLCVTVMLSPALMKRERRDKVEFQI